LNNRNGINNYKTENIIQGGFVFKFFIFEISLVEIIGLFSLEKRSGVPIVIFSWQSILAFALHKYSSMRTITLNQEMASHL